MCEKVDRLFQQELQKNRMIDLFGYVEKGGMSVSFAAKQAEMTPKEFKNQMVIHGFTVPQRGKKAVRAVQ